MVELDARAAELLKQASDAAEADEPRARYRQGRKLAQTIYEQDGDGPGRLLAFGATPDTAAEVVDLLNRAVEDTP